MSKKSSLTNRMDVRTREEFADDIKTYTGIEGFVMDKWVQEIRLISPDSTVVVSSTGVDNSGKLIDGFVGVNHDYQIEITDFGHFDPSTVIKLDVKHNYHDATATFKAHNLEAYIKNNIWILLILGTGLNGGELRPPSYEEAWRRSFGSRAWALLSPADIQRLILDIPCTKIKFMGGRPGYIVYKRQFDTYFDLKPFEKI